MVRVLVTPSEHKALTQHVGESSLSAFGRRAMLRMMEENHE
jgi:hypothetical protein